MQPVPRVTLCPGNPPAAPKFCQCVPCRPLVYSPPRLPDSLLFWTSCGGERGGSEMSPPEPYGRIIAVIRFWQALASKLNEAAEALRNGSKGSGQ